MYFVVKGKEIFKAKNNAEVKAIIGGMFHTVESFEEAVNEGIIEVYGSAKKISLGVKQPTVADVINLDDGETSFKARADVEKISRVLVKEIDLTKDVPPFPEGAPKAEMTEQHNSPITHGELDDDDDSDDDSDVMDFRSFGSASKEIAEKDKKPMARKSVLVKVPRQSMQEQQAQATEDANQAEAKSPLLSERIVAIFYALAKRFGVPMKITSSVKLLHSAMHKAAKASPTFLSDVTFERQGDMYVSNDIDEVLNMLSEAMIIDRLGLYYEISETLIKFYTDRVRNTFHKDFAVMVDDVSDAFILALEEKAFTNGVCHFCTMQLNAEGECPKCSGGK